MNKIRITDISVIILAGLLLFVLVNPIGNFPLNDDWMYSQVVSYMVSKGFYYAPQWYSPVLVAQVMWGALFSLPLGFSFTSLRISVIILAFACLIVFYLLVNRLTANRRLALLCALLLLVNPLFFTLSNTFMTDVPFITFAMFAIFFFSKALDSSKLKYILPAIIFSVIATLIRQFGVVIPIAYGVTQLIRTKPSLLNWGKHLFPSILVIIALEITLARLKQIGSELHPYQDDSVMSFFNKPDIIGYQIFERSSYLLYYSGVMLFPVLFFTGVHSFRALSSKQKAGTGVLLLFILPMLLFGWGKFPLGNIINSGYVGPKTLRDTTFLHINDIDNLSSAERTFLSAWGIIGALFLMVNAVAFIIWLLKPEEPGAIPATFSQRLFLILCTSGYAFLMFVPNFFFDRYLLPFMPLLLLVVVSQVRKDWQIKRLMFNFSILYILLLGVFSSLATHDYLQWNRTRWEALNYLTKELKVSPYRIDGGYEFNGWTIGTWFPQSKGKSWWFVDDDEYLISFGEVPGYSLLKKFPYTNYFPYGERNICIVHRN